MELKMKLRNETKTCYRFERLSDQGDLVTIYLKKKDVIDAGIDPRKGITVTIQEAECGEPGTDQFSG